MKTIVVVSDLQVRAEVEARFFSKVTEGESGCWNWTASLDGRGYAQFAPGRKYRGKRGPVRGHRWCYEFMIGEIPPWLELDHLCRNKLCVNPYHMDPVPHQVNVKRGSAGYHQGNRKPTCRRGHDMNINAHIRPSGKRLCRLCVKIREGRT